MTVDINSEDGLHIRKLVPFATMPGATFEALCPEMVIEEIKNECLFKIGDTNPDLIYLLSGEVSLQAEGLIIETIAAGTEAARFALAHQIPRKIDAVANGAVRFLRLDANSVNNPPPIEYKEDNSFMIVEEPEDDAGDWMTALLRLPVFRSLPPANLQKILIGLELVEFESGSVIIEQGASGDYYFLLKSGQCLISRKPSANAKEIKLGLLEKGDTFGEDSLITGAPRTVSITALTHVSLLRLDKQRFVSLIKEPVLKFVDYEDLEAVVQNGAILFDIRTPDEYEQRHIEGSINVPFFSLRMQLKTLNRDRTAIVICTDGKSSEAGAFLLLKNRFNALILKGGMEAVPLVEKSDSAQFTIDDGVETLVDFHEPEFPENQQAAPDGRAESSAYAHLEDQLRFLKSENEMFRRANQQLNEKCMRLEAEKDHIETQFKMISKQLQNAAQQVDDSRKGS